MSIDRKTRRRDLEKQWEETESTIKKVNDLKIIDAGRFSIANMRKTNKIQLIDNELIGKFGTNSANALLVVAEISGLSLRAIANVTPVVVVKGPTAINVTPQTSVNTNFQYIWQQIEKKDKNGETVSTSMLFKAWVGIAFIDDVTEEYIPLTMDFHLSLYNKAFYHELQNNKT